MSKFMKVWISVMGVSLFLLTTVLSFIAGITFVGYSISTNPEAYVDLVCTK